MILNPNCSEAVYRINYEVAKIKLTKEQLDILDRIIDSSESNYPKNDGCI